MSSLDIGISYWEDGSLHRKIRRLNGRLHREDGPAGICYRKDGSIYCEEWHLNGKLHREDGPAAIWYHPNGSIDGEWWYLNGVELSEEQIEELKLKLKIDKLTEQMLLGEL